MTLNANNGDADLRSMQTLAPTSAITEDKPAPVNPRTAETMAPLDAEPDAEPPTTLPHLQETLPPVDMQATTAPTDAPATRESNAVSAARGGVTATSPPRRDAHADPPAGHDLKPGAVVNGRYELIRELGRGGMGVVYLGRDIRLGRLVAVKFVLLRDGPMKKRFLTEARTTARCTHHNIVVVHEADEFHGLPYMVLEYLKGKTLRHLMDERASQEEGSSSDLRGRVSVARTLEIMLPVLRALERAHDMGIVHRDLKPENIMLTDAGVVKVLDFGIAKSVRAVPDGEAAGSPAMDASRSFEQGSATLAPRTKAKVGGLVGTLPYMSPEQLNLESADRRVDIWAIGIMLFEMIAGRHPMAPLSMSVYERIADVALPMPRSGELCPAVGALGPSIDRCLLKDKGHRIGSVAELIAELEPLVPGHRGVALADDTSPFTGLSAFQESDADRFFGRSEDTLAVVSRVREQPLVAVVGPSGAGKSSLVRAGVIPTLKCSGEGWKSFIARPGRAPLLALAEIASRVGSLTTTRTGRLSTTQPTEPGGRRVVDGLAEDNGEAADPAGRDAMVERLRAEPGYLGAILRTYAQRKLRRVVLFLDQFEEVYTLCADEGERAAFLACLAGVADDAGSPLRVVLSMRADFLERLAENRSFMGLATRGLTLLPPMGRAGLQAALEKPLATVGFRFESDETVRDMLDGLEGTRGALPLLQFAATTLWKERDRGRRLLTENSYRDMGGIAGTLARHADSVVAAMTAERRKVARAVFERLVTPERTRAVVSVDELREMGGVDGSAAEEVPEVLDELARARLLVVDTGTVEIVHESLIERWPTLRRWLDENQEDAAFLARLRTAAREWDGSGQAEGMLWSGQPAAEAQRWRDGYGGELSRLEQRFLDAVFALSRRARMRRRRLIYAAVAALALLIMAGGYAAIKGQNEAALQQQKAQLIEQRDQLTRLSDELADQKRQLEESLTQAEKARTAAREAEGRASRRADEAEEAHRQADAAEKKASQEAADARAARAEAERQRMRVEKLLARTEQSRRDADAARAEAERQKQAAEEAAGEIAEKKKEIQRLLKLQGLKQVEL